MASTSNTNGARWLPRLALAIWVSALPLVVFGGTVTTLRAGMAIDGWWVLDRGNGDHFLLAYPLEKWFANSGTFAEHTHRLCGVLVGLFAIAYVLAAARAVRRGAGASLALWAGAGLLAVCVQGLIGGLRVLENSPQLAFLHGALAQLVFASLAVNVVLSSRAWSAAPMRVERATASKRTAIVTSIVVYAQIVLGAWLRHTGAELPLVAHLGFAVVAAGAVLALARQATDSAAPVLVRSARRLRWLLFAQIALGALATVSILVLSGGFQGVVSSAEAITATLHVLLGALLLQQTIATGMWAHRLATAGSRETSVELGANVEGAR